MHVAGKLPLLFVASLIASLVASLGACTSVSKAPEFIQRVDRIEQARLEQLVLALHEIGPRPIEDVAATQRTMAWLRGQLEQSGYTVTEEEVTKVSPTAQLVARVRPADAPEETEITEIAFPAGFASYGTRVLESQSRRLRSEGWLVLGYAMKFGEGTPEPLVASNLLAEIEGTEHPDEVIEVSAHYDTVAGSPGASDNSSGVAVVLEMARVLAGGSPRRTIRFCFFAAEESGLLGSAVHMERLRQPDQPEVVALLNLDAVGFASAEPDTQQAPVRIPLVTWMPSTGDFITVIGTFSTGWLGNVFEACADVYAPDLEYYSANRIGGFFDDGRRSDHAHYWDAGIPALFLTDTGEFRSDNYHRPEDTPDQLDYVFLDRVARAATGTVLELSAQ